jgi:hypothetical protein
VASTSWVPPLLTVVDMAVPLKNTSCSAPLRMVVLTAVPPEIKEKGVMRRPSSSTPLLTTVATARPPE